MNIKQVAEMFDLPADTLRYYERVGIIPPVTRNSSGYRDYQTRDLNWVYLMKNLRKAGLSVEALIEYTALSQSTADTVDARKQILTDQLEILDQKIAEIHDIRKLLAYKLETYDDHIAKFKADNIKDDEIEKLWKIQHD